MNPPSPPVSRRLSSPRRLAALLLALLLVLAPVLEAAGSGDSSRPAVHGAVGVGFAVPPLSSATTGSLGDFLATFHERFSEQFSTGLAGQSGGMVAIQVGQKVKEAASQLLAPLTGGLIPAAVGRVVGPLLAQFVSTAISDTGMRWGTELYRTAVRGDARRPIDLAEVSAAAAGSTLGSSVLGVVLGPVVGRWIGGWLGYNLGVAVLKRFRSGHGLDLVGALQSLDLVNLFVNKLAVAAATGLAARLMPVAVLGTPVALVATLLATSAATALSSALYDTVVGPRGVATEAVRSSELSLLQESMARAYQKFLGLQRSRVPSDPELNWAFFEYQWARRAYDSALAAAVSGR